MHVLGFMRFTLEQNTQLIKLEMTFQQTVQSGRMSNQMSSILRGTSWLLWHESCHSDAVITTLMAHAG